MIDNQLYDDTRFETKKILMNIFKMNDSVNRFINLLENMHAVPFEKLYETKKMLVDHFAGCFSVQLNFHLHDSTDAENKMHPEAALNQILRLEIDILKLYASFIFSCNADTPVYSPVYKLAPNQYLSISDFGRGHAFSFKINSITHHDIKLPDSEYTALLSNGVPAVFMHLKDTTVKWLGNYKIEFEIEWADNEFGELFYVWPQYIHICE